MKTNKSKVSKSKDSYSTLSPSYLQCTYLKDQQIQQFSDTGNFFPFQIKIK